MIVSCELEEISDSNDSGNNNICAYSQRYKGVVRQQNRLWGAQIYTNNQRIWLGTFYCEEYAAIAYDRASIKLTTSDSPRNIIKCSKATHLEAKFQSLYNRETILAIIKDGSYQSRFNDFLRQKTDKENDKSCYCCGFAGWLLFEKELTPSDVGMLNELVIPKEYAVKFFPPPSDNDEASATLTFYDFDNKKWKFQYCYRKSCQSYVFTRGWNTLVKEKRLTAKDTITFHFKEDLGWPNLGIFMILTGEDVKSLVRTHKYLDQETSDEVIQTSNEVIQTSNEETRGFRLFGVQIA
ncbi:AP2/ERF and B3 domain-containing transcription factor like protein [Tanacetum coccineum]